MERRKKNLLQRLYSREVHGSFFRGRPFTRNMAIKLFGGSIPNRNILILRNMFGGRNKEIFLGPSRCGQFLITYSYTDMRHPLNWQYKYRLHWWAFRVRDAPYKVAEVQLFDSQDIQNPLHVGMAQWPNVNDRLIVYGYSDISDASFDDAVMADLDSSVANRKYFITVTTLPSLHNCRDCKVVAESFDEEDMAAGWDRAISFCCLRHGLTIHTTLDVAPPYPTFDPLTSLKIDNKIIVNTGNFLHVLDFFQTKEVKTSTERDTIVPDEISHRIGEILSSTLSDYTCPWTKAGSPSSRSVPHRKTLSKSINKAWLNTIMDRANEVYAFEDSADVCQEPRFKWFKKRRLADKMYEFCSDDEDMENKRPPAKCSRLPEPSRATMLRLERQMLSSEMDMDLMCNRPLNNGNSDVSLIYRDKPLFFKSLKHFTHGRSEQSETSNSKVNVPNSNICDSDVSNNCDIKPSTGVRESDTLTQQPIDLYNPLSLDFPNSVVSENPPEFVANEVKQGSVDSYQSCVNNPVTLVSESESTAVPSSSPPLNISIINPDLSAILAEWEADSVSSLSPKSDSLTKNDVIQSFLELIPGITISPRSSGFGSSSGMSEYSSPKVNDGAHSTTKMSSPNSSSVNKYSPLLVVLRTRNCNQDKETQKPKEQEDRLKVFSKEEAPPKVVKLTKEPDSLRQPMISGCSVKFNRNYIELDDEILSNISTDFEDDDQGTGFHCALPLSVHGSAYTQLQLVSSQKAEKLGMGCERVLQTSIDIEQFCFTASDIICECEGFKFWFCSDYDVELIDVCAINGDILGIVCLRVNAEKQPPKNEMYSKVNQRHFYGIKCLFIWNPVTDRCWLEAYTPLVETGQVGRAWEAPARQEAERLRDHLRSSTLFTLPPLTHSTIRAFEHQMWSFDVLRPSVDEIRDYRNLIGFRLQSIRPHRRRETGTEQRYVVEFWG